MLKSRREKTDDTPGEIPHRRSRASRRQINLPPIRNAGRYGRRHQRAAALCRGGGLPQHTRLHGRPRRGRESRKGYRARDRPRAEGLKSSWRALDAGNSGTTIRLLTGILAGQEFTSKLTGDASLQKRPMGRVVSPLREMGADIRAREDNFAPLEIRGAQAARHSLQNAHGQRASEIRGAASGIVR